MRCWRLGSSYDSGVEHDFKSGAHLLVRLTSDVAVETLHYRFADCEAKAIACRVHMLTLRVLALAKWRHQL